MFHFQFHDVFKGNAQPEWSKAAKTWTLNRAFTFCTYSLAGADFQSDNLLFKDVSQYTVYFSL